MPHESLILLSHFSMPKQISDFSILWSLFLTTGDKPIGGKDQP
jgi:hypothetical protein